MNSSGSMPQKKPAPIKDAKFRKKKGGAPPPHDDVDSRGNIRGLIDYDYDSDFTADDDSPVPRKTHNTRSKTAPKKKSLVSRSKIISKLEAEKSRLQKRLEKTTAEDPKNTKRKAPVVEDSEEEDEEEDESEEEEESEEYEDYDSEEDEEEYDESEEEDEDESVDNLSQHEMPHGISISIGGMDSHGSNLIPKRHNMKKETDQVKKFVKLVTAPSDENTIDNQIDQFKILPAEQRQKLIDVLERRNSPPSATNPSQSLMFKLMTMNLPPETQAIVLNKYKALQGMDPGSSEYFKQRSWLEKLTSLPLGIYKELPVKIEDGPDKCNDFMVRARKCLDDAIFGQDEAKLQVLQFIGTKLANPTGRGLSLLLTGPPGIGKTSLIKNGIAKAIDWPFQFISLGGDSDASTYTGHQLVYESSHCGKIVNSLASAKSMSMVLMFDEVDKISTTPKGEEVQNLLIHLTDPVQNGEFEDKYLAGITVDLSRSMFVFSGNNLEKIDRILLDRFVTIQLQGYSVKDKVTIADNYLIPQALKELGLDERIAVNKDVVPHILENYAKEEAGVRELKRCIEQIVQKINMLRLFNTKDLPFHIKDFQLPFVLKKEHVDIFLKKKAGGDESYKKMYT